MRTKVRVFTQTTAIGYKHLYIDLLASTGRRSMEIYATLRFQQGGLSSGSDEWYGMRMSTETDRPEGFIAAGRMLKFIKANTDYKAQPQEILKLIGAEEHVYLNGYFIPVTADGQPYYKVLRPEDGADSCYTIFYAADDKEAKKVMRRQGWDNPGWTFVPTGRVVSAQSNIGTI